jgi:type I restriction enzyme M protein
LSLDFNAFVKELDAAVEAFGLKLPAVERKQILGSVSWREETAAKVIKKSHTLTGKKLKELLAELRTRSRTPGRFWVLAN